MLTKSIVTVSCIGLFAACTSNENKTGSLENQADGNIHQTYSCPMHPEISGEKGDKCTKCGMKLQPKHRQEDAGVEVLLATLPQLVEAGKPTVLTLKVQQAGKTVSLDVNHEKKMHLMIMSEDLSWFRHIHPEEQAEGYFSVEGTFPYGGNYLLFVDYKIGGSKAASLTKLQMEVKGNANVNGSEGFEKLVSNADGYKITLENGSDFITGRTQALKLSLEKAGKKVSTTDLEPYLGANAHIVMIGKSDKEYLHIHPLANESFPIYAETLIENAGIYRIWVQFQTNRQVHTADFTVNVEQADEKQNKESHVEHHRH